LFNAQGASDPVVASGIFVLSLRAIQAERLFEPAEC
jgi:hypothetical protein